MNPTPRAEHSPPASTASTMYDYLIVPRAPLVFRSGRPFGVGGRDAAHFPWPSSLAGLLRTQVLDDRSEAYAAAHAATAAGDTGDTGAPPPWPGTVDREQQRALRALAAHGPLLAHCCAGKITPMLPRPADALLLADAHGAGAYQRLQPGALPAGCGCDLPTGLRPLLLPPGAGKGKVQPGPRFWPLSTLLAWRRGASVALPAHDEPPSETRTHVALARNTLAADPGRLFQSDGLDFSPRRRADRHGFTVEQWIFLARFAQAIAPRWVTFGGERRLSWLDTAPREVLAAPPEHLAALAGARRLTLSLATPALFAAGWRPAWLNDDLCGCPPACPDLQLRLVAAAVDGWLSVSGWDLVAAGDGAGRPTAGAKAARKAVPAGATYWFEVIGAPPDDWAERLWLAPIADDEQDRRDGFGLVIPGLWPTPQQQGEESAC